MHAKSCSTFSATLDVVLDNLPKEIRTYICTFLFVWERYGLLHPPIIKNSSRDVYHKYYNTLRKCPRGLKWNPQIPQFFYYRCQRYRFQWQITRGYWSPANDLTEYWNIEMMPQWKQGYNGDMDPVGTLLSHAPLFYKKVATPIFSNFIRSTTQAFPLYDPNTTTQSVLKLEFSIYRNDVYSIPTRQSCVESFFQYIQELSILAETMSRKRP